MDNQIWRIILDFEVLPDENFIAMFELIEQTIEQTIDPHEDSEECVRFWSMAAVDASHEYDQNMEFLQDENEDEFGLMGFIPEHVNTN